MYQSYLWPKSAWLLVSGAANDGLGLDFERSTEYCLQLWAFNFDWTDLLFQGTVSWGCCGVIVITVFAVDWIKRLFLNILVMKFFSSYVLLGHLIRQISFLRLKDIF